MKDKNKELVVQARALLKEAERGRESSFSEHNKYDVENYVSDVQEAIKILNKIR